MSMSVALSLTVLYTRGAASCFSTASNSHVTLTDAGCTRDLILLAALRFGAAYIYYYALALCVHNSIELKC